MVPKHQISSYCSINLLPTIGKLFEKILFKHITPIIQKKIVCYNTFAYIIWLQLMHPLYAALRVRDWYNHWGVQGVGHLHSLQAFRWSGSNFSVICTPRDVYDFKAYSSDQFATFASSNIRYSFGKSYIL
jgi:hypothetical protein